MSPVIGVPLAILCFISGWWMWYMDYRRRMRALREKYFPGGSIVYHAANTYFPWAYWYNDKISGSTQVCFTETKWGLRYAVNKKVRGLAKANRHERESW